MTDRPKLRWLAALLAGFTLFAACGDSGDEDPPTTEAAPADDSADDSADVPADDPADDDPADDDPGEAAGCSIPGDGGTTERVVHFRGADPFSQCVTSLDTCTDHDTGGARSGDGASGELVLAGFDPSLAGSTVVVEVTFGDDDVRKSVEAEIQSDGSAVTYVPLFTPGETGVVTGMELSGQRIELPEELQTSFTVSELGGDQPGDCTDEQLEAAEPFFPVAN